MAKALALYEGGINFRMQYGVRIDGALFRRFMENGPYGYYWTKWQSDEKIKTVDIENLPSILPAGFGDARIIDKRPRIRLPNN